MPGQIPPIHLMNGVQLTANQSPKSLGLMLIELVFHLSDHFHDHVHGNPPVIEYESFRLMNVSVTCCQHVALRKTAPRSAQILYGWVVVGPLLSHGPYSRI